MEYQLHKRVENEVKIDNEHSDEKEEKLETTRRRRGRPRKNKHDSLPVVPIKKEKPSSSTSPQSLSNSNSTSSRKLRNTRCQIKQELDINNDLVDAISKSMLSSRPRRVQGQPNIFDVETSAPGSATTAKVKVKTEVTATRRTKVKFKDETPILDDKVGEVHSVGRGYMCISVMKLDFLHVAYLAFICCCF